MVTSFQRMKRTERPAAAGRWPGGFAPLLLAALLLTGAPDARAQSAPPPAREYDIKAVFLFNFAQFAEWPASAFATTNSPFVIGVLGPDPFGAILDKTVQDERIRGRPIEVRRFSKPQEAPGCHLLFLGAGDKRRIEETIRLTRGRPILTVSDEPGGDRSGVMIALRTAKGRVRFGINAAAAESAGITISAKLLSVARTSEKEP